MATSGKGYVPIGNSNINGIWSNINITPFFPIIKPTTVDNQFKVSFNQGYVFDYCNADNLKNPIAVTNTEYTLSGSTPKKFYVLLKLNAQSGEVNSANIADQTEIDALEEADPDYKKLPITSEFHDNGLLPDDNTTVLNWPILLAEFTGGDIDKLYLRDNLHVNFQKFRQLGRQQASNAFPIIALENSLDPQLPNKVNQGNGTMAFSYLKIATANDGYPSCNALEMGYDYKTGAILLYVPCPTAANENQPVPKDPSEIPALGTPDPRNPNPPAPSPPVDPDPPVDPEPPVDPDPNPDPEPPPPIEEKTSLPKVHPSSGVDCPTIESLSTVVVVDPPDNTADNCFNSFGNLLNKRVNFSASIVLSGLDTTPCEWSASFKVTTAQGIVDLPSIGNITGNGEYTTSPRPIYVREGHTYSVTVCLYVRTVGFSGTCAGTKKACCKTETWEAPSLCEYTVSVLQPDYLTLSSLEKTPNTATHPAGSSVEVDFDPFSSLYGANHVGWIVNGTYKQVVREIQLTVNQDLVIKPLFDYTNYTPPP